MAEPANCPPNICFPLSQGKGHPERDYISQRPLQLCGHMTGSDQWDVSTVILPLEDTRVKNQAVLPCRKVRTQASGVITHTGWKGPVSLWKSHVPTRSTHTGPFHE